jgi:purine nucleoside phosphorylase
VLWLFALKGGQIAGIALLSTSNATHIAIVGGTGAYEGVSGSILSVSRGDNTPYTDDTVHLIWP